MNFAQWITTLLGLLLTLAADSLHLPAPHSPNGEAGAGGGGHHPPTTTMCESAKDDCCAIGHRTGLVAQSREELNYLIRASVENVSELLDGRRAKFDEFFQAILKNSRMLFNRMFVNTYGLLYEQNSYIFTEMFDELLRYYKNGGIDLGKTLDDFFQLLYKKMFQVLNSQYHFDEQYLACVGLKMETMKPFGDVPKKLTLEVKRSFIAARTFVQALASGSEVVKEVEKLGSASECCITLARLKHCPGNCAHLRGQKPCLGHCRRVMGSCLRRQLELHTEWDNFVDALLLLAARLETSFNIESVVVPINIKISEAIMNFQENGKVVSEKLFEVCGKPSVGKRSVNDDYKFGPMTGDSITASGTNMKRLIKDVRQKIKATKGYWGQMPEMLCKENHFSAPGGSETVGGRHHCWNGTDIDGADVAYMDQPSGGTHDLDYMKENVIKQQITSLRLITSRLDHAYNGIDVYWKNTLHSVNTNPFGTHPHPTAAAAEEHEYASPGGDSRRSWQINNNSNNHHNNNNHNRNNMNFNNHPLVGDDEDEDHFEGSGGSGDGPLFESDDEDDQLTIPGLNPEDGDHENAARNKEDEDEDTNNGEQHNSIYFSQPEMPRNRPETDTDNALNPLGPYPAVRTADKVRDAATSARPAPALILLSSLALVLILRPLILHEQR